MEPADRAALRAQRAEAIRQRRRRAGLGALAAAVLVVAAVLLFAGGGGSGEDQPLVIGPPGKAAQRSSAGNGAGAKAGANIGGPVPPGAPGAHRAPREAVPILMYHVIGTPKPGTPYPELWVTGDDFRSQVSALAAAGYHAVTLQQVWDAWHGRGLLPSKPVVFSFDDGYSGQVTEAAPALRTQGWPGVLNLKLDNLRDLRADRLRALIAAGWEVDSHTISHADLTSAGAARLRYELTASRGRLRREFGVPANFFCYPAGRYDARVIAAVRRAGYLAATTTDYGFARPQDTFVLGRVRVNGSDRAADLLAKLRSLAANPNAAPTPRGAGGG